MFSIGIHRLYLPLLAWHPTDGTRGYWRFSLLCSTPIVPMTRTCTLVRLLAPIDVYAAPLDFYHNPKDWL